MSKLSAVKELGELVVEGVTSLAKPLEREHQLLAKSKLADEAFGLKPAAASSVTDALAKPGLIPARERIDTIMTPQQVERLASDTYRAAGQWKELSPELSDLGIVSREHSALMRAVKQRLVSDGVTYNEPLSSKQLERLVREGLVSDSVAKPAVESIRYLSAKSENLIRDLEEHAAVTRGVLQSFSRDAGLPEALVKRQHIPNTKAGYQDGTVFFDDTTLSVTPLERLKGTVLEAAPHEATHLAHEFQILGLHADQLGIGKTATPAQIASLAKDTRISPATVERFLVARDGRFLTDSAADHAFNLKASLADFLKNDQSAFLGEKSKQLGQFSRLNEDQFLRGLRDDQFVDNAIRYLSPDLANPIPKALRYTLFSSKTGADVSLQTKQNMFAKFQKDVSAASERLGAEMKTDEARYFNRLHEREAVANGDLAVEYVRRLQRQ